MFNLRRNSLIISYNCAIFVKKKKVSGTLMGFIYQFVKFYKEVSVLRFKIFIQFYQLVTTLPEDEFPNISHNYAIFVISI